MDAMDKIVAQYESDTTPVCPNCGKDINITLDTECLQVTHFTCVCGYGFTDINNDAECHCEICQYFESIGA